MSPENEQAIGAELHGAPVELGNWSLPGRRAGAGTISLVAVWHRLAFVGVLLVATFLNVYQLSREGFGNTYYAAAVRSMLESWHNFFFVSFDPGGYVTVDKPAFGFWIQTASAKIFGFHGWSLI